MTGRLRLAVVQCSSIAADVHANLARLAETVHAAAVRGAQLVVFPEMYVTGYNIDERDIRDLAEPSDGPAMEFIRQAARDAAVHVCVGYPERGTDGRIYNSALICDPQGRVVLNYRKSHLFGHREKKVFAIPARQLPLVQVNGVAVGLLICYDVEFPENVRALAMAGADVVVVPTANMEPFRAVCETIVPARAYENQLYVAYANYCGDHDGLSYCGGSSIIDPDGTRLAHAGGRPELLLADLDQEAIRLSRDRHCYLDDRVDRAISAL
ncbi:MULTISPECIES: carbon-nitrogen hydrolase family protein [unclassified Mycolicibacterium]|uniref:carbon-nitrogen hydrolase family protein n=1 Tax=unclassified Mycolicibacterium TaxID=2636767 RepID=UPI0012DDFC21|nr:MULTISPECIES: carbon-nitrogen hydrolase family protein [unclassified Mycolicibacterium]MUL81642.1 carbon-nitrogen hydrolase family protein [Mycolicibacterium sp. CBMA 329]MUL87408.1 carbon-nitrogen hydrolase family protein [Mycolicibacterium sp. CBMA 331]MUL99726.1 carbon-nitrogen hydrolase family protein [Mycolicibacterium sp. CBMA 334]MUM25363.1 carbon-nitrogen hydrolase family protein [Mycolicibacterium sp. CBMA 295]MUM37705.1 carbon-nitrogen hydrolase family protein [Mycolicibacterium s